MLRARLNITSFILVILFWCASGYTQNNGRISGTVRDAKTGESMPGVNVTLVGTVLGATTDVQGLFQIQRVPPGSYQVRVSMIGYQRIEQKNVVVRLGQTTNLDFQLQETVIETPELVVTANKRRQTIQDSPTSVGVMTARDFKQKNEIFLDKLLEYASGVNFIESQINIRGSTGFSYGAGSRVLFLVDGVPVMPGDSGDIKWDLVPATQIDHVEIIKGAGSALYGGSALGGVVNVITKKASPRPITNLRYAAGLYDSPTYSEWKWTDRTLHFNDVNVDHSRRIGKMDVYGSLGRQQSTGFRQNGDYSRWNGSAKIYTPINGQHNLTFSSNYESGDRAAALLWRSQRNALQVSPEAIGDYVTSNKFSANLFHQYVYNKSFGLKSRVSYFRNYWKNFFHDNITASTAHRYGLELQGDYQISQENSVILGIEGAWDHVNSGLVGLHNQSAISAYVQNERKLVTNLILTLGVRYDHINIDTGFDDAQVNPKVGLVYHAQSNLTFRASSGRGFRAASMSERFPDSIYSGLRLIPNFDLKSETAWSHELGFNYIPSHSIYLDVAAFSSDYWDLIEPEPDTNNNVQFINVTRARISGAEASVKLNLWPKNMTLDISYTFMNPQDLDMDKVLAYRPKHLFNGSVSYNLGPMDLGVDYRYVSKMERVKVYPQDDRVDQKVLNARFSYRIARWTVAANANNLFNHNYTQRERILQPIRNYVLTLATTF